MIWKFPCHPVSSGIVTTYSPRPTQVRGAVYLLPLGLLPLFYKQEVRLRLLRFFGAAVNLESRFALENLGRLRLALLLV